MRPRGVQLARPRKAGGCVMLSRVLVIILGVIPILVIYISDRDTTVHRCSFWNIWKLHDPSDEIGS